MEKCTCCSEANARRYNKLNGDGIIYKRSRVAKVTLLHFGLICSGLRPHVNVVQFLAACLKPLCLVTGICNSFVITSEYLVNGNLYHYLRDHKDSVNESQRITWLTSISAGMRHLQDESIVHRDLAARNILLSSDLTPKIGDCN